MQTFLVSFENPEKKPVYWYPLNSYIPVCPRNCAVFELCRSFGGDKSLFGDLFELYRVLNWPFETHGPLKLDLLFRFWNSLMLEVLLVDCCIPEGQDSEGEAPCLPNKKNGTLHLICWFFIVLSLCSHQWIPRESLDASCQCQVHVSGILFFPVNVRNLSCGEGRHQLKYRWVPLNPKNQYQVKIGNWRISN